jgi:serine/threonine protein kinase
MAQSAAIPSVRQWRYARVRRRFIVGRMHDDSSPAQGGDDFGNANALPKGTRLSEFEIERVLGEGGFAIVYLAFDHSLHRRVALKEYLPAEFAFRQDENTIVLRSPKHQQTFEAGRNSFVQEARFLAQFEHPSLVKVHRVFESNGTAYMVQGYYAGESLGAAIKSGRRFASDAELEPVVAALVSAVELLHSRQCLHRDIAPDNIIVQPNGVPVLLDFGAARRIIGDMTQALTAVLKPSYAPIEQYTEDGGMAQGPWTDVYALAATIRAAITGKPPPSSVGRTIKDGLVKLADDPPPNFDLAFLRGVDAGMALLPADRPQTMAEFRAAMGLSADDTGDAARPPDASQAVPRASAPAPRPVTVLASHAAVPPPPIRMEATKATVPPPAARIEPVRAPTPPTPPRPTAARRRFKRSDAVLALIAAAAIALMLVVPLAADWIWPSPSSTPRPQVSRVFEPAARTALAAWKVRPQGARYQGEVALDFNLRQ